MPLPGRSGTGVGLVCSVLKHCCFVFCLALYFLFTRDTLSCCLIVNSAASSALHDSHTVTLVLGRHTEGSQHLGGSQEKSLSLRQYPLSYSIGFVFSYSMVFRLAGSRFSFCLLAQQLDLRWNLHHLIRLDLAVKSSIPLLPAHQLSISVAIIHPTLILSTLYPCT